MTIMEKKRKLFAPPVYDNLGKYKINADFVKIYTHEECYRELMVSYLPMLPLLEHTVPIDEADYILYMHMYARCQDYSDFVVWQLKEIAESRKEGAEIIVLGKAANAEKYLKDSIPNITFWGDHFTEKLGKKFGMDIKEEYFVYDDENEHLAIWPVDGCLNKCKFCRRCYMDIKFESLSLDTIRSNLNRIKQTCPEHLHTISLRAENLTEYGIDIYHKPMLHELLYLIASYDEVHDIKLDIGMCICEITPVILEALCSINKISSICINPEVGSERLSSFIGKKISYDHVIYIFKRLHEAHPDIDILMGVMVGLPTETVGDVYGLAKLIIACKPNHVQCNYFICAQNSPLAKYPQLTESCREYHLKLLKKYLKKLGNASKSIDSFELRCYHIDKKPNSRKAMKRRQDLLEENLYLASIGFLPLHDCDIVEYGWR